MKKAVLLFTVLASLVAKSADLPKVCLGSFESHIPEFEFVQDDKVIQAAAYDIKLHLFEDHLIYFCGKIAFTGFYESIDNSGGMVDMNISIKIGVSILFDFNLLMDKKTREMQISGLKGLPSTSLSRSSIKLRKL